MSVDEDLRAGATSSAAEGAAVPPASRGGSAVAGEQEERPPLLVLPPSRRPLHDAVAARLVADDTRPDNQPLLLRVDAVEPVQSTAGPVEENQRCAVLDQTIGVLPSGPSGASDVPTRVRADEPALFDIAPLLLAHIRTHIRILRQAAASRMPLHPRSPGGMTPRATTPDPARPGGVNGRVPLSGQVPEGMGMPLRRSAA